MTNQPKPKSKLCIDLERRGDGKSDCWDFTDEVDCRVIEFDSTYTKFLSLPVEVGQTKLFVFTSFNNFLI